MLNRPNWTDYFMEITKLVASRSSCIRRKVGAVIVKEQRILATGYNGVPKNIEHCSKENCIRTKNNIPSGQRHELCRGLHAEQNAIIQAALHGVSIKDSVLYCTTQPCIVCAKMLINADVKKIVFEGDYPDSLAMDMLKEAKIELIQYKKA
ncbi:MAG TPA: cytidine/deoxycytidylate deaminase family protein [bacterium]|nr:cytidine/deoxycytidylate deaminase family protein [bacterium]HPN29591.1 cytidine/deoxycytidylate deaminase family protein [bacterium]